MASATSSVKEIVITTNRFISVLDMQHSIDIIMDECTIDLIIHASQSGTEATRRIIMAVLDAADDFIETLSMDSLPVITIKTAEALEIKICEKFGPKGIVLLNMLFSSIRLCSGVADWTVTFYK